MKIKIYIIIIIFAIPLILFSGYEFFLFSSNGFSKDYQKIDRCLDSGGRWNDVTKTCENDESESVLSCGYWSIEKTKDNPFGELQPYENCATINNKGIIKFRDEHFKKVNFGSDSISSIYVTGYGHGYIHKNGKIAIMHEFDNGPDPFSEDLARTIINQKIGFVNRSLDIVIPIQFDAAFPFEKGKSKVGVNCQNVTDGEHSYWDCKEWYYIDKKGTRL